MTSLDSITQALAVLSITPSETVQHASATSPAAWKEALRNVPKTPKEFELLKVLVFKPKTAKSATPIPVVVVARDDTETSSSSLGKKLNLKELRLASEDLLSEFFSLDKDSCKSPSCVLLCFSNTCASVSPLALNAERFPGITTVVDASLATVKVPLAVRARSSSETVFLSGPDILTYLRNLETAEAKVHEVDFVALKSEMVDGVAAQAKPAEKKEKKAEKDDAKIEGAVQIAIGVKKEADFAAWYTNVSTCALFRWYTLNKNLWKVLIKADMLDYYSVSGCYVLKPWSYSIWEVIQGNGLSTSTLRDGTYADRR
jgi:prolyl-tRNA synthetase